MLISYRTKRNERFRKNILKLAPPNTALYSNLSNSSVIAIVYKNTTQIKKYWNLNVKFELNNTDCDDCGRRHFLHTS